MSYNIVLASNLFGVRKLKYSNKRGLLAAIIIAYNYPYLYYINRSSRLMLITVYTNKTFAFIIYMLCIIIIYGFDFPLAAQVIIVIISSPRKFSRPQ